MARTRNTAKKITGGTARRVSLKTRTQDEGMDVDITLPAPPPVSVLPLPDADQITKCSNNFCSLDLNGGHLYICACGRALCSPGCIKVQSKVEADMEFLCPICFEKANPNGGGYRPFVGLPEEVAIPTAMNTRATLPFIYSDTVAVLAFRLEGMPRISAASHLVYCHLAEYFETDGPNPTIAYFDVEFNFENDKGLREFEKRMNQVLPKLQKYQRFLVFIISHSTPDEGTIWVQPEPTPCAVTPEEFFEAAFSDKLLEIIHRDKSALLFLIMCGGPNVHKDSRTQIQAFISKNFWLGFGFAKEDFHPSISHVFLQQLTEKFCIYRQPALFSSILQSNVDLGAHVQGVFVYIGNNTGSRVSHTTCQYCWHQELIRPHGRSMAVSCHICKTFRPWKVVSKPKSLKDQSITITCINCDLKIIVPQPENIFLVSKHSHADGVLGCWMVQYVDSDITPSGPPSLKHPLL